MRILYPYGEEFTGERARELHTLQRAHSLARAGFEVDLVAGTSPAFASPEALLKRFDLAPEPRLRIHFLPRRVNFAGFHVTSTRIFYGGLGAWLKQQQPFDAAYLIHLKAADYLQRAWPALPVIFEAHEIFADSFADTGGGRFEKLAAQEKRIYGRSRAVVATSNYLLDELKRRYPVPSRALVSPNCVEQAFFDVPPGRADGRRLIYAGSFQPWKGVPVAIAAMKLLPEYTLTVIGGQPEQVRELAGEAPANVEFAGYQPRAVVVRRLAEANVALIPNLLRPKSSLYSFPMKLLEYAAAGRLVVASDIPVLRELNLGSWAQLVEPENPQALADAIRALSSRAGDREVAQQWAKGFIWDRQAEIIGEFLEKLFKSR